MPHQIRTATAADVDALLDINAEAVPATLPAAWLRDAAVYRQQQRLALLAESDDGQIDAFCLTTWVLDEASLLLIAVRTRARRRGLGRALLMALLDQLSARGVERCLLEVRDTNTAALTLYHSCGFVTDGRRRGYYPPGETGVHEDALLMSWTGKVDKHGRT